LANRTVTPAWFLLRVSARIGGLYQDQLEPLKAKANQLGLQSSEKGLKRMVNPVRKDASARL